MNCFPFFREMTTMAITVTMDKLVALIFYPDTDKTFNNNIRDRTFPGKTIRATLMGKDTRVVNSIKAEFQTFRDNLFQIQISRDKIFPGKDLTVIRATTVNIPGTMSTGKGIPLDQCTMGRIVLERMATLNTHTRAWIMRIRVLSWILLRISKDAAKLLRP